MKNVGHYKKEDEWHNLVPCCPQGLLSFQGFQSGTSLSQPEQRCQGLSLGQFPCKACALSLSTSFPNTRSLFVPGSEHQCLNPSVVCLDWQGLSKLSSQRSFWCDTLLVLQCEQEGGVAFNKGERNSWGRGTSVSTSTWLLVCLSYNSSFHHHLPDTFSWRYQRLDWGPSTCKQELYHHYGLSPWQRWWSVCEMLKTGPS